MRKTRTPTYHNELVIVCEGSTTEYNYFDEIRAHIQNGLFPDCPYTYIHIIPGDSDNVDSTRRKQKTMYGSKDNLRYFEKKEDTVEYYKKYHSQPVRYVREAELFLSDPVAPYDEAWAVYDWDVKPDKPMEKKHQDVLPLLQRNPSKLNVAFSSYSFEEWILLHFEQNDTVFICSDCSDEKDNSFMCGTHPLGYNGHDCHGNLCIAGYLRERNYISNYTKGDKHIFFQYTLKNGRVRQEALYNAAWIRSRSRRFSEQPYTDVDELVCRMTGTKERVIWRRLGETFLFGATELNIIRTTKTLLIENTGDKTCLLKYGNITTTDNPLQKGDSVCTNSAEVLPEGECKEIPFSSEKKYLRIADGDNTVIIEL